MNPVFDKVYAPPRFSEVLPKTRISSYLNSLTEKQSNVAKE